ncbi:MAG: hypothetical protein PWP71_2286 [Clostridia bacterium]|jgi:hypothetical protein|nr:hypothetical protein [Clostridia bacterium]
MKFKKGDILIFIFLLIAVIGWFLQDSIWTDVDKKIAIIEIDGEIYNTIFFDNLKDKQEFTIDLPDNNYIYITSEKDGIYVNDASCPDKVCEKTGKISKAGQNIVCLPNKVVIYIQGANEKNIDDVSY